MNKYVTPLTERYASEEMSFIFSPLNKYKIWRNLWIALAEGEMKLGLNILPEQINEMEKNLENFDWGKIAEYENKTRHEVIAHIHGFGEVAPGAKPIIHLGSTSAYVMDNGDIIQYKQALQLIKKRVINVIYRLKNFALNYKNTACLGFTHFQPAQPVTVGKRACLWIYDLILDYLDIVNRIDNLPLLGVKGTTGTQASFMKLFNNNEEKVKSLEDFVVKKMGFSKAVPVSGQTYSRKIDYQIADVLSSIAQSASKFAYDVRLLMNLKEIEEPFETKQVGSSAMPYKRNPMRCERINALSRFVINASLNMAHTHATQWLERTLDDSAIKRISLTESFLATDAILIIYGNVSSGIVVYDKMIEKHLDFELPFLATEDILMECVNKGGSRQDVHEAIREISNEVTKSIKLEGKENDLIKKIVEDERIILDENNIKDILNAENFTGRASSQVDEFINNSVLPIINNEYHLIEDAISDIKV